MHLKVYLSLSVHWWQNKHLHIIIGFFLPSPKKNGFYRFHVKIMSVKKQSSKNPSFFLSISHWHKQLKSPLFSIFQNISYAFLFSFFLHPFLTLIIFQPLTIVHSLHQPLSVSVSLSQPGFSHYLKAFMVCNSSRGSICLLTHSSVRPPPSTPRPPHFLP